MSLFFYPFVLLNRLLTKKIVLSHFTDKHNDRVKYVFFQCGIIKKMLQLKTHSKSSTLVHRVDLR